ncbi:MAG: PKD domain-containing protein [Myxococcales bacterium]|nr:PKD domain-containing protein [Myxococcales bacterium]
MTIRYARHTFDIAATILLLVPAAPVAADGPTYVLTQEISQDEVAGLGPVFGGLDLCGNRMAIGAGTEPNEFGIRTGAAYTYDLTDGLWVQTQRIEPTSMEEDRFGQSVAIRGDWLAVGAPYDGLSTRPHISGAVQTYFNGSGQWFEEQRFTPTAGGSNTRFGLDVEIDGDTLAVAVPGYIREAKVRFYERVGGQWVFDQEIGPPEPYNYQITAIDLVDDVMIMSSRKDPSPTVAFVINVFRRTNGTWVYEQTLEAPEPSAEDSFFRAALSGTRLVVGAPEYDVGSSRSVGVAYVYEYAGGQWDLAERIASPYTGWNVRFGGAVEIAEDRVIVGAPGLDVVYVYDWNGQTWSTTQVLTGDVDSEFGLRILMHDKYLVVMNWGTLSGGDRNSLFVFEYENQPPIGDAGSDSVAVAGEPIELDGSASYDPNDRIVSYTWDFGDGNQATGAVVSHIYSSVGIYTVSLTVTDEFGAAATDEALVTVLARPVADAGPDVRVLVTIEATLDGSASSDPDGFIVDYDWDFGDGATGTGVNATHWWAPPGTYTATLSVTDNDGLRAADTATVVVTTPSEAATDLAAAVDALAVDGKLSQQQAGALRKMVTEAKDRIDDGNPRAAERKLFDLTKKLQNLVKSGKLGQADADPLIRAAEDIIQVISNL